MQTNEIVLNMVQHHKPVR